MNLLAGVEALSFAIDIVSFELHLKIKMFHSFIKNSLKVACRHYSTTIDIFINYSHCCIGEVILFYVFIFSAVINVAVNNLQCNVIFVHKYCRMILTLSMEKILF